ncbi:hypothetical protein [Kaistella montana]|uniref:Uncharacterized protein n=1 Tax=Kaistella montana TaxID=1849733 RepID=A0ABW5KAJ0_9FLAO|nr:hypothetical protein [Kaistella montana]MCQ4035478.1 hypothetical protein [Kaistella montana]
MKNLLGLIMNNKNSRKWVPLAVASALMCAALFTFSSCERAEGNAVKEVAKPYCYYENGQTVCYESPK